MPFSSFQNIFFSRRFKPDTPTTYLFEGAEWILLLRGINFLPTPFSAQYTSDVSLASKIQTHCASTNSRQGTGKEISPSPALSRVATQETAALPPPKKSIEFPFFFSRTCRRRNSSFQGSIYPRYCEIKVSERGENLNGSLRVNKTPIMVFSRIFHRANPDGDYAN